MHTSSFVGNSPKALILAAACAGVMVSSALAVLPDITVTAPVAGRVVVGSAPLPIFNLANNSASNIGITAAVSPTLNITYLPQPSGTAISGNGSISTNFAANGTSIVTVNDALSGVAGDLVNVNLSVTPSGGTAISDSVNYRLVQNRALTGAFNLDAGRHMFSQSLGTLTLSGGTQDDDHATRVTVPAYGQVYANGAQGSLYLTNSSASPFVFNGPTQTTTVNVKAGSPGAYAVNLALPATNQHTSYSTTTAGYGGLISVEGLRGADIDLSGVTLNATGEALVDRSLVAAPITVARVMVADVGRTSIQVNETFRVDNGSTTYSTDSAATRLLLNTTDTTQSGLRAVNATSAQFRSSTASAAVAVTGAIAINDRNTLGERTTSVDIGSAIANDEAAVLPGQTVQTSLPMQVKYHMLADNVVEGQDVIIYRWSDANAIGNGFTNRTIARKFNTDTHTNITLSNGFYPTANTGTVHMTTAAGSIVAEGLTAENAQSSFDYNYSTRSVDHSLSNATPYYQQAASVNAGDDLVVANAAGANKADIDNVMYLYGAFGFTAGTQTTTPRNPWQAQPLHFTLTPGQDRTITTGYTGPTTTTGGFDKVVQAFITLNQFEDFTTTGNAAEVYGGNSQVFGDARSGSTVYKMEKILHSTNATGTESGYTGDLGDEGRSLTSSRSTTASLIDSLQFNTPVSFSMSFADSTTNTDTGHGDLASDIVTLTGLGGKLHVVQINYDPNKGVGQALEWLHHDSANVGSWINAVLGNTNITDLDLAAGTLKVDLGTIINVADYLASMKFDGSYGGYLIANNRTDPNLGAFGVDTVSHQVWAVIDHNSDFAAAVPEPASLSLLAMGGLTLLRRRRGELAKDAGATR